MLRAAILGFGGLIAGCAPARYVPKHPETRTAAPMIPARVLQRSAEGDELVVEAQLPHRARLHGAYAAYRGPPSYDFIDPGSVRCAEHTVDAIAVDGKRIDGSEPVEVGGAHEIHVFTHSLPDYVVFDLEMEGRRQCVPVRVEWPEAWRRDGPWEVLLSLGGDLHVAGGDEVRGVGGARLALFRWFDRSRLGAEVGLVNVEICEEDPCEPGGGAFVIPAGLEADWFFYADGSEFGSAFLGVGARAMAYAPMPGTEPRATLTFSPQAALRLVASFPPRGPSPLPAGLTLDHGVYFGPAATADTDAVALLFGFSIGVGLAH